MKPAAQEYLLRFAGAPRAALSALETARSEAMQRPASYFNVADNFLAATAAGLAAQRTAFKAVATARAWAEEEPDVEDLEARMMACGTLAGRSGHHHSAASLATLALQQVPLVPEVQAVVQDTCAKAAEGPLECAPPASDVLELAARLLWADGLVEPWPATLAHVLANSDRATQAAVGPLIAALDMAALEQRRPGIASPALTPGTLVLSENIVREASDRATSPHTSHIPHYT